MDFNILKIYPQLLDLACLTVSQRNESLKAVFKRDIEDNPKFQFRSKWIRPIKKDGQVSMEILLNHLITKEDKDEKGKKIGSRSFDMARSQRLHWVKFHIEESRSDVIDVFSFIDRVKGRSVTRTYIYDIEQEYVIILEPQRSGTDYYLLTAYYLNEPGGKKQIENKQKKKLPDVY
ncbi:hypothetical protein [Paludibacter sp.]|uniref:hypothetical protein n=1 Tax=Paludibacter sp. TaxID=1898105 RepID=UPI001352531C|nr:hypothetical protein [Paludibacter sp.]MTK53747.1 hypothetical protein [Paludibacter sp.]